MNKSIVHAIAGSIAMTTIAMFWASTLISELLLSHEAVVLVKHMIAHYGLYVLVLAMMSVGASGALMAKHRQGRLVDAKKKRMRALAINGLLVMIPAALFLNHKAQANEFDAVFYVVQVIELLVGAGQLTLMGLNFRDGLKLTGRLRSRTVTSGAP